MVNSMKKIYCKHITVRSGEQIEQNAEEYAKKHYDIPFEDNSSMNVIVSEESYIAGAHSRDNEIEELMKRIEELEDEVAQLANGEDY